MRAAACESNVWRAIASSAARRDRIVRRASRSYRAPHVAIGSLAARRDRVVGRTSRAHRTPRVACASFAAAIAIAPVCAHALCVRIAGCPAAGARAGPRPPLHPSPVSSPIRDAGTHDARREQRTLVMMCVIIAVNQLGFGALIPVLPLYASSFGVSVSAVGATIAVYGLARLLLALPGGRMSDAIGRRPTLAIGGLVSALGNLACAFAPAFPAFLAGRFIAGAGAALVLTTGSVILADISPAERRGRTMAIYQGVFLFAVGIGPWPGGVLAERYGLQAPFLVYAVAATLVGLVAWFAVPETRALAHAWHAAGSTHGPGRPRATSAVPFTRQLRELLALRSFVLIGLVGLVNAVVRTGGLFNVIPLVAVGELGLTAGQVGSAFAIGGVLGLVATYPAGSLADRWGRKLVIVPSVMLTAGALAAFSLAPSYAWFVLANTVWGVATAVSGAAPAAYAADSAPPGMNAAAMSGYRTISDLGYVIGPIGLGLLVDWQGPHATLWAAALLTLAVGAVFARYAPETHRPRPGAAARATTPPR